MAKSKKNHGNRFPLRCLCLHSSCSINMCIPFCKRNACNEENRLCRFSAWYDLETGK